MSVYPDDQPKVTVYHYGTHTYVPIKRPPSTQMEAAVAAFKQSRTLKPERFVNDKLIEAIENEDSLENIGELTDSFVNRHALE